MGASFGGRATCRTRDETCVSGNPERRRGSPGQLRQPPSVQDESCLLFAAERPSLSVLLCLSASLSVRSSRAQMLLKAGTLCGFVLTRVLRGAGLQSHICHRLKTQESAVFKSWKGTCQPRALMIFKICLVVPGRCSFIHVH